MLFMLFVSNCFILELKNTKSPFIREKILNAFNKFTKNNDVESTNVNFWISSLYKLIEYDVKFGAVRDDLLWIVKRKELNIILKNILNKCLMSKS